MYKLGMSCKIAVWESLIKGRGIFSGLFRIIEVRPSAGVRVNGALVVERGGNRGGGGGGRESEEKERKKHRRFGPRAGLVPIRPEARGRFVCTGRTSQRRTEAAWCCSSQPGRHRGNISCSASLSWPSVSVPFLNPSFPPTVLEQNPNESFKLFTDVLCLCAIHESCALNSRQRSWPYCPRNTASGMYTFFRWEHYPVYYSVRLHLMGMQRQVYHWNGLGCSVALTHSF